METEELIPIDIEYEREYLDLEDELDEVAELPPPKKAKTKSKNKKQRRQEKEEDFNRLVFLLDASHKR